MTWRARSLWEKFIQSKRQRITHVGDVSRWTGTRQCELEHAARHQRPIEYGTLRQTFCVTTSCTAQNISVTKMWAHLSYAAY